MTIKKFWENLTLSNIKFTIQGYWRTYVSHRKPKKLTVEEKAKKCPECWEAGECIVCNCPIVPMFQSDKPCPNGKF